MRFVVLSILLCFALQTKSQVIINEILADNMTVLADPDYQDFGDWIELYNEGASSLDYNAYRLAILFINGQYWGIHNIREKVGDDYLEENHGVDKDNIDLISQQHDVREGDFSAYSELITFVRGHDMSTEENYAFARERMQIGHLEKGLYYLVLVSGKQQVSKAFLKL